MRRRRLGPSCGRSKHADGDPTRFDAAYSGATVQVGALVRAPSLKIKCFQGSLIDKDSAFTLPLLLHFSGRFKKEKDSFNDQGKRLERCDQFGIFIYFGFVILDRMMMIWCCPWTEPNSPLFPLHWGKHARTFSASCSNLSTVPLPTLTPIPLVPPLPSYIPLNTTPPSHQHPSIRRLPYR